MRTLSSTRVFATVQVLFSTLSSLQLEKIIVHFSVFFRPVWLHYILLQLSCRLAFSVLLIFPLFRSTKPPSHHGISSLWKSARLPHKKPRANRPSEAHPLHFPDLQGTADMASLSLVCSFFWPLKLVIKYNCLFLLHLCIGYGVPIK